MRLTIAGLAVLGMVHGAAASDYRMPVLRGSLFDQPPQFDWSGYYVGGHIGYSSAPIDFGQSGSSLIANILRNTLIENEFSPSTWVSPEGHGNGTPFGLFVGHNWQSDDIVFGLDMIYSHTANSGGGSDSLARNITTSDDTNYDVFVTATMAAKITDLLSIRARGGVTYGSFMPFGTIGIAVGRVNIDRSATVRTIQYDNNDPPNVVADITDSESDSQKGAFAYGFSAGLGFDWALMHNLFLRGEYEYVGFAPVKDIRITLHTARAGLGARF